MILAAGRGERMRPLTDACPKPLQPIGSYTLIEHHLLRLAAAGVNEVVINVSWLGDKIRSKLGDGSAYGLVIYWSEEPPGALETGGALRQALPLIGSEPFLLVNGDVWSDYPFEQLCGVELAPRDLVHLVMVPNPPRNPDGDFSLNNGRLTPRVGGKYTYSGIGVYRPEIVAAELPGRFPLAPLLRRAIDNDKAAAELYTGDWRDIGTVQALESLQREMQ